jgi:hypothetical protein
VVPQLTIYRINADILHIEFLSSVETGEIHIYNMEGRLVMEKHHISGRQAAIDVSTLSPGMYVLAVQHDRQSTLMRFLKN